MSERTLPTPEQIRARITEVSDQDLLGFMSMDLIHALPFELAKEFLREGHDLTPETWDAQHRVYGEAEVRDAAAKYLEFAYEKANGCRGISADRSVGHYQQWLFLLGYTKAAKELYRNYQFYGKPCLVTAATILGLDWSLHDDGKWVNGEYDQPLDAAEREVEIAAAIQRAKDWTE